MTLQHHRLQPDVYPIAFLRQDLKEKGYITCDDAMTSKDRRNVSVAGMVNVRQHMSTRMKVLFRAGLAITIVICLYWYGKITS